MVIVKLVNGDTLRFHDADGFNAIAFGVEVGNSSFVPMAQIQWVTIQVPETVPNEASRV